MQKHLSPDELYRIEIAYAVSRAIFGGAAVSLVALAFYDGGRVLQLLIGG